MQTASTGETSYRCAANVLDPEAEAGYRTYGLALAFPDSVRADNSTEVESEFAQMGLTLSLEPTADSTAADSTALQIASRIRCNVPSTEDALALMADRVEADLRDHFGQDGYRFVDSDGSDQSSSHSSNQNGAAVTSKTVMEDPDCDGSMSDYDSMPECEYESGVVVDGDPVDDGPIDIPPPPDPGDPDGIDDPGGGSSPAPTECTGTLQGPTSTSTTAQPAYGDVPTWLIPQPDADPGSDLLDPDYPDNPTPADPGGTECDEDEPTAPCESDDPPAHCDDEDEPPCESNEPPEYCDEAGSCFDAEIGNEEHQAVIEAIELDNGFNSLWSRSMDLGLESHGWIIEGSDGQLSFRELAPSEGNTLPCYVVTRKDAVPSDAIGYIHTHPAEIGETVNCRVDPFSSETVPFTYEGKVSEYDYDSVEQGNLEFGIMIDHTGIKLFDENEVETSVSRCGY